MYILFKIALTALLVTAISELARKYSIVAAALASLPLTSIMAMVWLYHDTHDLQKISTLSYDILWLVVPSLLFFLVLPLCIEHGFKFYTALIASCIIMSAGYAAFLLVKKLVA